MKKRKRYAFCVSIGDALKLCHLVSLDVEGLERVFIFPDLSEFLG
jgi:hypothetical protein